MSPMPLTEAQKSAMDVEDIREAFQGIAWYQGFVAGVVIGTIVGIVIAGCFVLLALSKGTP